MNDMQNPALPMTNFTTQERESIDLSGQIQGWGADLDPSVRPGVPRDKAPSVGIETLYPNIEPQIPRVKINKSTEHGKMPPVFGTSCPPQFVSGAIRNFAYTYSEGKFAHWLLLMFADRVNVVEDLVKDLSLGHIPNIPKEMGLAAEWKYNRKGFLLKSAAIGFGLACVVGLVTNRDRILRRS